VSGRKIALFTNQHRPITEVFMDNLNLDEKELAAGAAVAMSMAREDRRHDKEREAQKMSGSSVAIAIGFVLISSVGMLALMLAMDK